MDALFAVLEDGEIEGTNSNLGTQAICGKRAGQGRVMAAKLSGWLINGRSSAPHGWLNLQHSRSGVRFHQSICEGDADNSDVAGCNVRGRWCPCSPPRWINRGAELLIGSVPFSRIWPA